MAGINKTSRVMIKIIQAEDSIQILQQHQPTLSGFNKFTLKMWIGGIFPIARLSDCQIVRIRLSVLSGVDQIQTSPSSALVWLGVIVVGSVSD